jgi:hypothetical protein
VDFRVKCLLFLCECNTHTRTCRQNLVKLKFIKFLYHPPSGLRVFFPHTYKRTEGLSIVIDSPQSQVRKDRTYVNLFSLNPTIYFCIPFYFCFRSSFRYSSRIHTAPRFTHLFIPFFAFYLFSFFIYFVSFWAGKKRINKYKEIKSKDERNEETEWDKSSLGYVLASLKTHTALI